MQPYLQVEHGDSLVVVYPALTHLLWVQSLAGSLPRVCRWFCSSLWGGGSLLYMCRGFHAAQTPCLVPKKKKEEKEKEKKKKNVVQDQMW